MACACNKNREKYEVGADGSTGKVLFGPSTEATRKAVRMRYPGSTARKKVPAPSK